MNYDLEVISAGRTVLRSFESADERNSVVACLELLALSPSMMKWRIIDPIKSIQGFIMTVQILISAPEINNQVDAQQWVSDMLSEQNKDFVLDWGYLKLRDKGYATPEAIEIPGNYSEGDLINDESL